MKLNIKIKILLVKYRGFDVMPGLHLPRAPCDIFVYDFPYEFSGIVVGTGYDVCVYIIFDKRAIFVCIIQGLIGTNPYGSCMGTARKSRDVSSVKVQSPYDFLWATN